MVDAEYSPHWRCGKCKKLYGDMFQAEDCCEEPKKQVQEINEKVGVENEPNAEITTTDEKATGN